MCQLCCWATPPASQSPPLPQGRPAQKLIPHRQICIYFLAALELVPQETRPTARRPHTLSLVPGASAMPLGKFGGVALWGSVALAMPPRINKTVTVSVAPYQEFVPVLATAPRHSKPHSVALAECGGPPDEHPDLSELVGDVLDETVQHTFPSALACGPTPMQYRKTL